MPILMRFVHGKFFIYAQILTYKRKLMRLLGVFQQAAKVFETVTLLPAESSHHAGTSRCRILGGHCLQCLNNGFLQRFACAGSSPTQEGLQLREGFFASREKSGE